MSGFGRGVVRDAGKAGEEGGRSMGRRLMGAVGKAAAAVGGVAAVIGIRNLGRAALESAQGIQQTRAVLTGLLGSAESAADTMQRVRDVARTSPIEYSSYNSAAEAFAYLGVEGTQLESILGNVGAAITAAGGTGEDLERVSGAMTNMTNQGKVLRQDLNVLSAAGVPIFDGLAKHFDVTVEELNRMITDGQVGIEDVMSVMEHGTGDYFEMMIEASDEASNTWSAQWAMAKDNIITAIAEGIDPMLSALTPALEAFGQWVGPAIESGMAAIGRGFGWVRDNVLPVLQSIWGYVQDSIVPAFQNAAEVVKDALGGAFESLSSWFSENQGDISSVVEWIGDRLPDAIEAAGNIIGWLIDRGVALAGWVDRNRVVVGGLLAAYAGFRAVQTVIAAVTAVKLGFTAASYGAAGATYATGAATRIYNALMNIQLARTKLLTVLTKGKTAAMWLLNAAMRANPIGIVVTVLAALAAGLVLAWNNSETFRNIVTGAWDAVKNAASAAWDWISDVFDWLMDGLSGVGQWFTDRGEEIVGAWNSVKDGIAAGWNWISDTFDSVKDGLSSVGGWFSDRGEDIKSAWNGVRDGLAAGWGSIRDNVFSAFSDRFAQVTSFFENDSGAIGSTFRWLRDQLSAAWNWIDRNVFSVFRAAFELVRSLFSRDSDRINAAWQGLKDSLVNAYRQIVSRVTEPFKRAFGAVRDFFSNRVDDMKGYWRSLQGAFRSVYNWINTNVFQRFRDGLSWLGDRVADARDRIRNIWETVANTFRRPINWVIRNVWNDGIASVFNRVASAIGIDTRLNTASELPMYAKGGHAKKGWALVGEEGPELVRFPQAGYVYTASETAGMLARGGPGTGEDFSESRPPDGGIWGGIANAVGSAVDWVRGGLADLAGAVLDPIVDRIAGGLSGYGSTGELFGDTMNSAVDSLMDWIRGEDDVMKGVLGPGFKESGATGRIQGATAAMNAAAWNIWNAIPGLRGMHSLSQSMVGPHRTGNAVDFYGPSNALAATAAYAASNAAQLGIRQVIYNWRLWQGGGWGRLGSTGGNDPGHVWHVHVASHGGGARIWDAPRNIGRPGVYDDGGLLPHGQTALNLSRKPEAVLTNKQWADVHTMIHDRAAGGDTWNLYGIPMDHAKQTADEIMHAQRVHRRGSSYARSR